MLYVLQASFHVKKEPSLKYHDNRRKSYEVINEETCEDKICQKRVTLRENGKRIYMSLSGSVNYNWCMHSAFFQNISNFKRELFLVMSGKISLVSKYAK